MFKLESYITPVILSYVEKYVKNFKPEQSQVSLWGGDASFQNLDLRLEVLEEQLNLPFTFVSGHIHELLIHVPWVKITSEPIVVTINTIECILNLKDQGQVEQSTTMNPGTGSKLIQEETPSSYIKSIVTKVINNITINCNNLILKYVEEDIVLSVNVRFLSMQTVNELWEPAFIDVSSAEVTLRKIVAVEDLTLCLDKMDTAGKIEIYQDPVLYRCSMVIRLMMNYNSNVARCASLTRFDLHCEKMEFSMTEQQLPMLLRLIALITNLQAKQSVVRNDNSSLSSDERGELTQDDVDQVHRASSEVPTWGGWAWDAVTSFLPVDWDPAWTDEQQDCSTGHVIHMGVYIDDAVLTFKTIETLQEQLFYKSRKIRYNSFLTLRVTGAVMSMLVKGVHMSNLQFGLGSINLHPRGACSCGYQEVADGVQPPLYIQAGAIRNDYLKHSLFDKNVVEQLDWKKYYSEYDIDYHLATVNAGSMLQRSPAFGMDMICSIEIPDDFPLEKLSEFESNYEYSNFPERKIIQYVVGDLKVRLCSGLMHRINAVKSAAKYDHNLYTVEKYELSFDELPPVTVEEYEALRENVSVVETYFNCYQLAIQFQPNDHNAVKLPNQSTVVESTSSNLEPALSHDPHLSIECSEIAGSIVQPMYSFRLASCASQQADIAPEMLNDCYSISNIKVCGVQSQLYLTRHCHTTIVMPCNATASRKSLVYPQYWRHTSLIHDLVECEIDDITFTGTKPKLMAAISIALSIADPSESSNRLLSSSLLTDACNEKDSIHLELSLEHILCKQIRSSSTTSIKIDVDSVKAFALNGTQQAFILSGPENDFDREMENTVLLSALLQYSETDSDQVHPSILSFRISEMRFSLDPLLCHWLEYQAIYKKSNNVYSTQPGTETPAAEGIFSDTDVRKKIFRTLHESVHSLSDKEKKRSSSQTDWSKGISGTDDLQKKLPTNDDSELEELQKSGTSNKIARLHPICRKLVLCGSVGHFVMYIPSITMDGIGAAGIELAKDRALNRDPDLHIFMIKSPTMLIHSVNMQFEQLLPHLKQLPSQLPNGMWSQEYHSFPWTLRLNNLNCYTLKGSSRMNLIRNIDLTATIDITTKSAGTELIDSSLAGLGLCVYIDTSPIVISISEEQINLLNNISSDIIKLINLANCPDEQMLSRTLAEPEGLYFDIPKSPSSYTQILYPENTTTPSSISTARDSSDPEIESPIITAMIQWTVTKMSVKLYIWDEARNTSMKLVLELEDIITTLDWQPIYLKLKNKITTATICHYARTEPDQHWELGDYAGLIMLGRESNLEQMEDTGFLSVTFTKAQSGNVHTRWGAQKNPKSQKTRAKRNFPLLAKGYITEIDVNIQRVDIILPPSIVKKFMVLMKPFTYTSCEEDTSKESNTALSVLRGEDFANKSLPLVYLEFKGMNLMVPTSPHAEHRLQHNLLMIQLDGISITPSPENPICRTILRSDIYEFAAQSNILNIPGSSVEDRQYQVNIKGVCACTTTWQNYQQNNTKRISQSYLYTMNENPALEWNSLACESNVEPQFSTSLLMSRFDVRLIIAPAVILHPSKIVCGGAFEVTCLTDIEVSINLDQIKLIWDIYNEISIVLSDYSNTARRVDQGGGESRSSTPVISSSQVLQGALLSKEHEPDHNADSGIDFESSSANYIAMRKVPAHGNSTALPMEILVNCGTVSISLNLMTTTSIEATTSSNDPSSNEESYFEYPIFHVMMIEPNFYISQLNGTEKMQISCFDVAVSLGGVKESNSSPSEASAERKLALIESKSGSPHPDTGIPPSFLILKREKTHNTSMHLFIDIGRPTKINCSILAFKHIDHIKEEMSACFVDHKILHDSATAGSSEIKYSRTNPVPQKMNAQRKSTKFDLPELSFTTKQLVLSLNTNSETNILISVARSSGNTSRNIKSERISGILTLNSLIISAQHCNNIKVFLNPSCYRLTVKLFLETWQDSDDDPQVTIQANSESIYLEFGPEQMKILDDALKEYYTFMDYLNLHSSVRAGENKKDTSTADQHYKDDLKAGAFQFVNGNSDEQPSPYQVIFSTYPEKGIAWKYPQPRIITGLDVAPIPFEISDDVDLEVDPISCSLEYWSDSHGAYRRYVEFNLSETENYRPELPTMPPSQAVASTWRVILSPRGNPQSAETVIAPQVLVGCLRIDSYFNAAIVPNLQVAVNIGIIHVSVSNPLKSSTYEKLPHPLANFRLSGFIPEVQCFAQLEHKRTSIIFNRWTSGAVLIDIRGNLTVKLLDYGLLRMQDVIDQLESNIQVSVSNETNISMECNPFSIKFGPSIAHTLAVSTNLWLTSFNDDHNEYGVMLTRVIVANDSNVAIRFGQSNSTDNILLQSRECHFYYWRHTSNRMLHVAIENTGWTWSQPFCVNKNGKQLVMFGNSSTYPLICARVDSLSATQKLITFSGLLVLSNRLVERFEMKLVKYQVESQNKPIVSDELHSINGNDQSPSIVLESNANMAMRLRFASSTSLSWTGDIPLKTNSKWGQPWLVKVPLQDRGEFLSIWVRIVQETIHGKTRILAVLSPLYMIKSYLPVPVVVQIETPSLGVSSNATINGQGKLQQLYCPGTFEHSHQLTFQLESGISASNPYVPLSYSSVEKQTFFKRPQNENIDAILTDLEKRNNTFYLPFQADEPNIQIPADQPQTHVQIKYQDAGLVSSTLLLELQPWCFILNTLGCRISLIAEDIELCQIPHNGIITPPKLEGTFHLKVELEDTYYASPALQLARPDWNQGFYMPRIKGLVPVDGNIQASIECQTTVCVVTINSKMQEDMRIVRITASHVICNFTPHELCVASLAVGKGSSGINFPDDHSLYSFIISPSKYRSQGTPIVQWHMVDPRNTSEHEALYISLSRGSSWSCPVRVDQNTTQRCIAISDGVSAVPVVITTHEDDGASYVLIHTDDHPQLYIENLCPFRLLLGEANRDFDGICQEAFHFTWKCEIESGTACYYSTPSVGNRLPDRQTSDPFPKLLLSALPSNYNEMEQTDKIRVMWSRPINISHPMGGRIEQYVRLPVYGDIKLLMEKRCHTIRLHVLCLSQVEVSAHDIRTRLTIKETQYPDTKSSQSAWSDSRVIVKTSEDLGSPIASASSSARGSICDDNKQKVRQSNVPSKGGDLPPTVKALEGSFTLYIRGINVLLMQDFNESGKRVEIASLCLSDLIVLTTSTPRSLTLCVCIGDIQLDNQMFDHGGFDFPVVFINQHPYTARGPRFCLKSSSKNHITDIQSESLVTVDCAWEVDVPIYACTNVNIKIGPASAYIEDTFITQLLDYTTSTSPPCFIASSCDPKPSQMQSFPNAVSVPESIVLEAANLRTPLRLQKFTIEPISVLLSVHTSVRLYVALDHSPLYFGAFEREHLLTTPSGLANALTMHYLSGALFGAGWVVGSLEILGSPGGFAQALGSGLKDFVTLPIQGILRGPWSFIMGVTQGSASLMKHLTAGTVNSVTKLASSVARNLDRLTLDDEHLQRQEESRRTRPQGMAQGLYQGLTGFGISLLAAVGGLAHHPLQQIVSGAATTRGLVTGVGLGIVGAVTKPLSGAAELVALTGQGLLEGTGWNPLPTPRQRPIVECLDGPNNSPFKYAWQLLPLLTINGDRILHIANADFLNSEGVDRTVMLILTRQTLVLVNVEEDSVDKRFLLKDLISEEHTSDPTQLCLYSLQTQNPPERSSSPIEYPEMDQAMRARVEQFVRGSSTRCTSFSTSTDVQPETIERPQTHPDHTLNFYIKSEKRNYLLSLFEAAKRQDQGNDFIVL